ncbi:MAG TPA: type II toxin-antitoxin system VapC family toxin [Streptosporangiaceae bacterium]
MRLLLDTHVLLWWLDSPERLSDIASVAIANEPAIFVSAVTAWEIAIKRAVGKLDARFDVIVEIEQEGFQQLPVTFEHALAAGSLDPHHRDPFDRMLVAQARSEDLVLVTADLQMSKYDVRVLPA